MHRERYAGFVPLLGVFQAGSCLCGAEEEEEEEDEVVPPVWLLSHFHLCFYTFVSLFETNGVWWHEI